MIVEIKKKNKRGTLKLIVLSNSYLSPCDTNCYFYKKPECSLSYRPCDDLISLYHHFELAYAIRKNQG